MCLSSNAQKLQLVASGGDGSVVVCHHLVDENKLAGSTSLGAKRRLEEVNAEVDVVTNQPLGSEEKKKKRVAHFPPAQDFDRKLEKVKPIKWVDLCLGTIFRVTRTDEVLFEESDGKERVSWYAELEDSTGESVKVWLPGIVAK